MRRPGSKSEERRILVQSKGMVRLHLQIGKEGGITADMRADQVAHRTAAWNLHFPGCKITQEVLEDDA